MYGKQKDCGRKPLQDNGSKPRKRLHDGKLPYSYEIHGKLPKMASKITFMVIL